MKIEGTVAIVTGGASGIGKAICEKLLQGGAKIYFLDINKTLGEETQKSFNNQHGVGQAKFVCCDITSHDQLEGAFGAAVKEHGRLDIVVNNAAIMDENDWDKTLNTALRKKGIRVNCVCPGGTDTDIYKSMERMELTKEQQELASNTPKQRPEAVAQCVMDLIKDETDVGQVVKVTYEDGVEFLNYNDIVI